MRKRILFVVPYVPSLIRVRPYNLVRSLAELGHEITLLTLWSDELERESLAQLQPYTHRVIATHLPRWRSLWNCLAAVPTGKPLQSVFCWEPELARQIQSLVENNGNQQFDVVHVEHLRGAAYGLHLQALQANQLKRIPVVWDSVDSISMLFRQAVAGSQSPVRRGLTRFELGRTARYEAWLLSQFDGVTVTSPADRQAFLDLLPSQTTLEHMFILPNGVDLDYFHSDTSVERQADTLVVSGKMSYHANVAMVMRLAEEILPRVWARRPEARLVVVGKDPPREVQALAADPRVAVTGYVSDLPPYLQQAAVAVAPIAYGAGIQNKVLEAMACETPVVASRQAVAALSTVNGRHLLAAGDADEFAGAVLSLLENPTLRAQIGQAGRRYVEREHHWPAVAARLAEIYTLVGQARRTGVN